MYNRNNRALNIAGILIIVAIAASLVAGCGGGGDKVAPVPVVAPPAGVPAGGVVVTTNPTATMPFSQVQKLARGTAMSIRLNRAGFTVWEYPSTFLATDTKTGEKLVQCQMPPTVAIGAGDSGATLLYNGKIIGGLCYGLSSGNSEDYQARSIEEMAEVNGLVGTAAQAKAKAAAVQGGRYEIPLAVQCNASQRAIDFANKLAAEHGSAQLAVTSTAATNPQTNTRGGVPESATVIAGQSISVNYITGPLLNGGAVGSLTYLQPNRTWLVFGHPLAFTGQRAIPVTLASMIEMIEDPVWGTFKQALPTNEPLGALTGDWQPACLVDPKVTAATSPITVTGTVGGKTSAYRHQLLRDSGSYSETGFCGMIVFTSLDKALGRIAPMASKGKVTIKFAGVAAQTFDIITPTPATSTAGGDTTVSHPSDAASEATRAVMDHVYELGSNSKI